MTFIITMIFFGFGVIIGSFLNVVIYRFNTGKTFGGRSVCMSCNRQLSWHELIPVLSFAMQKGKCKGCKSKVSIQYPLVEILTGFIFAAIFLKYQLLFWLNTVDFTITLAYYATLFSLLMVVAVYDIRHKIIPDVLSFVFGLVSFGGIFFFLNGNYYIHTPGLFEYLSGLILAAPFAFFWLVSRGRWMGLGDAKLALGLGWMLGLSFGLSALVLAFWLGALFGIILLFISKKHNIKSEIPFAPFLIIGTLLVFLFEMNFFPFY
ncbi:MAG: prepilin peptidase [Candidatus Nomurabacteria bacterium]|nr:prepilin peptidase [Candidatus Nomurabacteria bacterium]